MAKFCFILKGTGLLLPVFSNTDGISKDFHEIADYLKKKKHLNDFISRNIKHAKDFIANQNIGFHSVNILVFLNECETYLSIFEHNLNLMQKLETGDRVDFNRGYYTHSAIFVGKMKIFFCCCCC